MGTNGRRPEPFERAPAPQRARVLIADDHDLARAGMRAVLADLRDIEIVAEAQDGAEAVALCQKLRPDLVITDLRMPQMDGVQVTAAIKQAYPSTLVLVVTVSETPEHLEAAMQAGADAFVLKDADRREIVRTLRTLLRRARSAAAEGASSRPRGSRAARGRAEPPER
jgi:DNA-binding NarL/FixJ family response regulator